MAQRAPPRPLLPLPLTHRQHRICLTIGVYPSGSTPLAALKQQRHLKGELVFCKPDGSSFKENECKWPLWRACGKAGLRRVSWHVLRHTFASHLAMKGVPLKAVQELMGHATIEMTMRYAHLSPEVGRQAVQLLDGYGNLTATPPGVKDKQAN